MKERVVYPIAVFFSLLLSYWIGAREAVINPDAICYLQSAESISTVGLHAATQLCDQSHWPFYSLLIFTLVRVTHISYLSSAYLWDGFFSCVSVLTFLYITSLLGGTRRVLAFAAVVILFAHEFNSVRQYIIRDHGFWAFYLVSVAMLIQYCRAPTWRYAILWSLASLLATLFRVEGVIFLLAMPLMVVLQREKTLSQRCRMFLQLNTVTLLLAVMLLVWILLRHADLQQSRLGEVQMQITQGYSLLIQRFHAASNALAQQVLSPYAASDASWILSMMLITWYGVSVISNVSIVFTALIIYAWFRKCLTIDAPTRRVIWAYIVVNVLITAVFLAENMFISKRYLIALSLLLMLWVPFALEDLYQRIRLHWIFYVALSLIVLTSLGGIFDFGYSKQYINDAGVWLAENVPAQAALYSNDEQVMYYSKHFGNDIFVKSREYSDSAVALSQDKWKQYDYLALRLNKNTDQIQNQINVSPVQVFKNKRGDQVIIYKVIR